MQEMFTVTGGFYQNMGELFTAQTFISTPVLCQHLPHGGVASPAEFAFGAGLQQKAHVKANNGVI